MVQAPCIIPLSCAGRMQALVKMKYRFAIPLFVTTETFFYVSFMMIDLCRLPVNSMPLKYAGILVCVMSSFFFSHSSKDLRIPAALTFTAVADYFLLVINCYYEIGVAIFILTQGLYAAYLWRQKGRSLLIIRIVFPLGIISMAAFTGCLSLSLLNILASVYFPQLLLNALQAWMRYTSCSSRESLCLALGLTLFIGCDVCVGLYNLNFTQNRTLLWIVMVGMWLFYLPSQFLITLASLERKKD